MQITDSKACYRFICYPCWRKGDGPPTIKSFIYLCPLRKFYARSVTFGLAGLKAVSLGPFLDLRTLLRSTVCMLGER